MCHLILVLNFTDVPQEYDRPCDQKNYIGHSNRSSCISSLFAESVAAVAIRRDSDSATQVDSEGDDEYNQDA